MFRVGPGCNQCVWGVFIGVGVGVYYFIVF